MISEKNLLRHVQSYKTDFHNVTEYRTFPPHVLCRIVVMEDGNVIEFGSPSELTDNPSSAFSQLLQKQRTSDSSSASSDQDEERDNTRHSRRDSGDPTSDQDHEAR